MVKILVVDDEPMQRLRLRHVLASAGHEVLEAQDGREALNVLADEVVQILITDWNMPNMDGLELCKAIRARETTEYVYIIFLTSQNEMGSLVDAITAGADDYLFKPAHPAELKVRVAAGERTVSLLAKDLTIFALAKLSESRDPETGHHLERVQCYCWLLAEQLRRSKTFQEIDAPFVRLIVETSPLHDIGKVAIPDAILQKPGKLTDEEFTIMKSHTTHGSETLEAALRRNPTARFLRMAADIAASHHEKVNGTGYPQGLSKDQIPLSARIVALADVYDALTTKRCYKDAFSHDKTRSIIVGDSGKHFDERVVDAFLAVENDFVRFRGMIEQGQVQDALRELRQPGSPR